MKLRRAPNLTITPDQREFLDQWEAGRRERGTAWKPPRKLSEEDIAKLLEETRKSYKIDHPRNPMQHLSSRQTPETRTSLDADNSQPKRVL